jgi:hypothetical protein
VDLGPARPGHRAVPPLPPACPAALHARVALRIAYLKNGYHLQTPRRSPLR